MFALKPRKEFVIRTLLIAVMSFNALGPTAAVAKSLTTQDDWINRSSSKHYEITDTNLLPYPHEDQRFARPTARVNKEANIAALAAQPMTGTALTCISPKGTYTTCSQIAPYIVRIDFNVPTSSEEWSRGYSIRNSAPTPLYFSFHWDAGGWWYRYGYDAYNTSQARGFMVGLNGLGYYSQSGYFAPVAGNGTYRTNAQGNYWIDGPFVGGDYLGQSNGQLGVRNWDITILLGGLSSLTNMTGYSGTGYFLVSSVPLVLDSNSVLFSGSSGPAGVFGGFGPTESPCLTSCSGGSQGLEGDPINTRSGAFSVGVSDLSFPTSAGELIFQRSYSSAATSLYSSPFGYGWTHNHDAKLILPSDPGGSAGYIIFKDVIGNQHKFKIESDGSYSPALGVTASLAKSATEYTLAASDQSTFHFDLIGRLTSRANAQGRAFNYLYDTQGKLDRVSADNGAHFIQFGYDSQGRIDSVTDHAGREVTYTYDTTGDLVTAVDVTEQIWTYTYDTHRMTQVDDPNGDPTLRTEYDTQERAFRQWDGADKKLVELTYNADGTTTVTDAAGKTQIHTYDGRGTLRKQENGAGGEQGKQYDPNFRPDLITDALENPTILDWSDSGSNLEYVKDALNGETFISYNSNNQPTSIIDPQEYETKYFYTDTSFPTLPTRIEYPLSFDGGATYIGTDYEYYPPSSGAAAGKIKFVTDALGRETYYTYDSSGQVDTITTAYQTPAAQTTDYDYDDLGRLIKVTDPAGGITRSKYDPAGRLIVTINNVDPGTPDAEYPPQNLVSGENIYNLYTRFYYDARGNQTAVVDTDWNITRTYYDGADRPVGTVQNLVINGTPANSEAEAITAITTPLASVPAYDPDHSDWNVRTETEYDDAGNVIVTRDPAGVIIRTYYDEANRPELVIQNWAGTDLYGDITTAPAYSPAAPDQNVRTEYFYDLNGNVIAATDTLGVITRTYYDELNRPETVVQNLTGQDISVETPPARGISSNIRTDTSYDANGNVTVTEDPRGLKTRTYYDSLNRPASIVQNFVGDINNDDPPERPLDALTAAISTNIRTDTWYDKAGNVVATVDPRGVWTRTYYDEANRPVATLQDWTGSDLYGDLTTAPAYNPAVPDQNVRMTVAYDSDGRRDTTTDPLGRVTKYEYNDSGQVFKTIANYVNSGEPQNGQDQRNIVTQYAYDAPGRQVQATDTLGRVTRNAYDDLGRLTSVTQNYLQGQAQNYKDSSGNQYNLVTTYSYDVGGNQISVTDTAGVITRSYYDALSRPVAVVRNLDGQDISNPGPPARTGTPDPVKNLRTDTVYLGTGSVDSVLDEMGKITEYSYDDLGRLIATLDPLEKPTSFGYDANGNRTLMTDGEDRSTRYEYDNLNHLTAVIENYSTTQPANYETNVRTSYTYDANGNRLSIRDGNSHLEDIDYRTMFTYDGLGRLEMETDPLGHMTTYQYDAVGNRVSLLDANGATTTYEYDELSRLELIDYPAPDADVMFDYDALGRRQSMTDSLGTTAWDYNNLNLPMGITDPFGTGVSYDYDALGNRTNLGYADQAFVYEYDAVNRLEEVTGSGLPNKVEYGYEASGRLKTVTRPNGVNSLYNYYDNGWLQDVIHSSGAAALASYEYLYDNVGNRTHVTENILLPSLPSTATSTATFTQTGTVTAISTETATATASQTSTPTATPVTYTYTSQPDETAGMDTYLLSTSAAANYGTDADLGAGESNDATDQVARALVKFDLSSIPTNAVITSATLSLWTSSDYSDNDRSIRVYRLKMAFGEAGATWNESAAGVSWEAAGAAGPNDKESTDIGSIQILANEALDVEKQITLAPSKIQEWIDGTFTNHGFILIADTELDDRFSYASSDSATISNRPKLVIQYTLPQGRAPSDNFALVRFALPRPEPAKKALLAPAHQIDPTETPTETPTGTPTETATPTATQIPTGTEMETPTETPTDAITYTPTETPTETPTLTLSPTTTITQTATATSVPLVNFALGKTATQSSTYGSKGASLAVDGNTNGNYGSGTVTHTNNNAHAWWEVDLGLSVYISNIELWNRTDCCGSRLSNYYVFVSDDPFTSTDLNATLNQSGVSNFYQSAQAGRPTVIAINRTGHYVRVQLAGTNYLSIAEAKVLGPASTVTPTASATSTSTATPTRTPTPSPTPIPGLGQTIITYDYDPLYRLTDVHYSIGDYYHYTYDAVGNRLEQTSMVSGLSSTVEYVYDDANRLTTSNGVTYTWDANGNLLSDGIKTYTYDSAN
ncbi:MAG: DNRLRE domain-containing protein, partial [Chloroflexi bacterium]